MRMALQSRRPISQSVPLAGPAALAVSSLKQALLPMIVPSGDWIPQVQLFSLW